MHQIDIFQSANKRSGGERRRRLDQETPVHLKVGDFDEYGFDYFDNENMPYGYAGYQYDGRYKDIVPIFCDVFQLKRGDRILEVGCAKGYILFEFYAQGFDVSGVDASRYAIEHSKEEIRDKIQLNSSSILPFEDQTFDFVLAKEVVPHLEEPEAIDLIKECMRVATGSGIFLEIQCAETEESASMMKMWDQTHKTIRSAKWWETQLTNIDFNGAYHCKELF